MSKLVEEFVRRYGRLPTERDPDYLEMLQMSKYRIKPVPDVMPGKCANCGASKEDGRQYVDFGLHVDWYGVVFLCTFCVNDIAVNTGLFDKYTEEIRNLRQHIADSRFEAQRGVDIRDQFLKTFEEVKSYYESLPVTGDGTISDSDTSVELDEKTPRSENPDADSSGSPRARTRATKSTSSSGRTDVPSLAELLKQSDSK